jgi:type I restriction-modification system DNA methylase subunit
MAKTTVPASKFDDAHEKISKLAATFKSNEARYLSSNYQEAETRKDFIDKFFIALGWDVNHDEQTNPYEQEVKVEPPVSAGGQRRADYAFHLAPNYRDVRFFVEAKKPHGDLATADNYFQVIRYGWNTETPLAVLTDFKQFHVLDCRYEPDIATVLNRHVAKYHYSDYLDREKFAEIYWLFSREAVADSSLEKRAKDLPKPRGKAVQYGLFPGGYQSIDESFLKKLDEHRYALARNFKSNNPTLDGETLTELVQRTLDRLVFLRFLEDKGIEPRRIVDRFGDKGTAWEDFIAASRRLNGIYNGIIFKHHTLLDSDKLRIDETAFADICENLAHVNSPYDFDAIPIPILGSIYERFLGNVIVVTDKRVRIEPKPEVRKAGGVYYTPKHIVSYIVESTIGKLIADKNPDQIGEMRFADIACGSGSFLLGVFDLLLTYHGRYYNNNPKKARKGDCVTHDGKLYLSLRKKREILLNNIYGVDIDAQAVEVCQLSLYLRLLKEETTGSAHQYQLEFAHTEHMKKLLPDLSKNIVCGNSVIGTDILDGQLFARQEERTLNPMDFEDAFPEVMKRGGFDAIVGNPPWISLSGKFGNEIYPKTAIDYLINRYQANTYMPNMYEYFVANGLTLTHNGGRFSFIVPDRLGFNSQFVGLRKRILDESRIQTLVYKVPFPGITADTLIFVVEKGTADQKHVVSISEYGKKAILTPQCELLKRPGYRFEYFENADVMRMAAIVENAQNVVPVSGLCETTSGFGGKSQLITPVRQSKSQIKTIKGDSIGRYELRKQYWFDFKKENITGRTTDVVKLGAPEKLLLRKTGDSVIATYDDSGVFPEQSLYFFYANRSSMSFKFILGILNSRLINAYYKAVCLTNKKSIAQVKKVDLDQVPIRVLNLRDPIDKSRHDQMVAKVEAILDAKKELANAKTDKDKTYYENKCAALDRQIDALVYDLYGMTKEEIEIVEQQK